MRTSAAMPFVKSFIILRLLFEVNDNPNFVLKNIRKNLGGCI